MRISLCLLATGILGCAESRYVYTPEVTNAVTSGLPASRTAIPPERPQGTVEVTSTGVAELRRDNARIPAIHVRMVVTNEGDDMPWHVDTRRQLISIPNEGRAAPIYVNAGVSTLPDVPIERRQRRVVDLYYPAPVTVSRDRDLPRFSLLWEVKTSERTVASRTAFDRVDVEPTMLPDYGWAGYGPYWWYDPLYPPMVFVHSRPIIVRDHRGPIRVHRHHTRRGRR